MQNRIELVLELLSLERIDFNFVSPNFVADFACERGIALTSKEVVYISNTYENSLTELI